MHIFYRNCVVVSSIFEKRNFTTNREKFRCYAYQIGQGAPYSTCNSFFRSGFEISYSVSQIKHERIPLQPHDRTVSICVLFSFREIRRITMTNACESRTTNLTNTKLQKSILESTQAQVIASIDISILTKNEYFVPHYLNQFKKKSLLIIINYN